MPFNVAEAINFVNDIAREEQVRVSVGNSLKGGAAVGCAAVAGGLLLGPVGLAIGGAVGGVGAAIAMKDKFVSLPTAIANMTPEQKRLLTNRLESIAAGLDATDIAQLAILIAGSSGIRERVVCELVTYIGREIQVAIA